MMREHRTLVLKGNEKSALSTHNLRTGHTFDWDHVEVVDTEPMRDLHKVTESIHIYIRLRNLDINREQGYDLPPMYTQCHDFFLVMVAIGQNFLFRPIAIITKNYSWLPYYILKTHTVVSLY